MTDNKYILALEIYVGVNFVLSVLLYFSMKKFFSEKKLEKEGKLIDIHSEYPEFKRYDDQHFSYFRLFFGLNLFFWVKFTSLMLVLILFSIYLK